MKYTPIFFIFLSVIFFNSLSFAQHIKFSDAERTIIRLQDERRGIDSISAFLTSKEDRVAWRAAIALANINDSSSRPALIARLSKETRPEVIDAIAFALGVMGPNAKAYKALSAAAQKKGSAELFIALGRTVPKEEVSAFAETLGNPKTPSSCAAVALVEIGLRKLINEDFAKTVDKLQNNNDASIRWQCMYAYSRTEDSALLNQHIDAIKQSLINDLGSPECRMFAATALGRIHNEEAGNILVTAGRSELEWRVRVNILNALAKLPRFSSSIYDIIKKAVTEEAKENPVADHVALTAFDALDQIIATGKLTSPDSATVREWLDDYQPKLERHEDQFIRVRSGAMIPLARLDADHSRIAEISGYLSYHDLGANKNAWAALSRIADTTAFIRLIRGIFTNGGSNGNNVIFILEGLHSLWEKAKKDTLFWNQLQQYRYAAAYRHLLIRISAQNDDIGIVTTSLEELKDTLIVTDSMRSEAEEYLLGYLDTYGDDKHQDQLLSLMSTIAWLKPKNDTFKIKIKNIYEQSISIWGNQMIADTARFALHALGVEQALQKAKLIRNPIDWKTIEMLPDTMFISTQYGFLFVKNNTYEAPLSVLNIYKLAKRSFFLNNTFHRVVPNFVIQSGDISGTGFGGPGFSIRTEIAPLRYDSAGVVGMASSGKDTEGSQWFITHCPTPHLDTRYTIWGEVVKGKENIDKIQFNDLETNIIPYK